MPISSSGADVKDISYVREQFPGTQRWAYFDVAARALLPRSTREAVDGYLDSLMSDGGDKPEMFRVAESARSRFAALIGAEPDEIAITKNVSEGLNIIATAYPWQRGDKVVLCAEREHPNNLYIWQHLAHRYGIEVVLVKSSRRPHRRGRPDCRVRPTNADGNGIIDQLSPRPAYEFLIC